MARTVEECERMVDVLAPEFAPRDLESLREIRVGVAWTESAEPEVRARVEEAVERFPNRRRLEFAPPPDEVQDKISDLFQAEVADVHRDLYAEHADLYGENVAAKIEKCLAVTDAEVKGAAEARAGYRDRALEAIADVDLLAVPTLPCVAPPVGIGDRALRATLIRFTFPFNALGWPALALPCGPAEDGLPASLQLVGRPGDDALVLAAGRLLASLVRGTPAAA
jgi:aspartyl-tRNA(Asn)/glutamyl-tRNA(Gln) amidotransferase subunit A